MSDYNRRFISAAALTAYQSCRLRYRFRYIDGLYWSKLWGSTSVERLTLERGQDFHLMARRMYAGLNPGLPSTDSLERNDELRSWLQLLGANLPLTLDRSFYPELSLRLNRPGYQLQANFDLLVVDPNGRAAIYDWKTESRPLNRQRLLAAAQTRIYRYMLCAAGGVYSPWGIFRPDQVEMVYWNPHYPRKQERLAYSDKEYQRDERDLSEQIGEILATPVRGLLATTDLKTCAHCEYQMICHGRHTERVDSPDEEIEEDGTAYLR